MGPDGARRKQDQAELRIGRFPFTEDRIRNFTDERKCDGRGVIALHIHERFDQLGLIDAHQFARFALEIPDPDVGQNLEGRSKSTLRQPRAAGYAAQAASLAIEKTDQAVALAEGVGAKNDGLRLLERHSFFLVGAPTLRCRSACAREISRKKIEFVTYHTQRSESIAKRAAPAFFAGFSRPAAQAC